MARPANQASGVGDTNAPKGKRYAWGGGKAVHSKSEGAHLDALKAKLSARAAAPAPVDPLYASAQLQAKGMYQPQVDALHTLQSGAPVWFENFKKQAAAAAAASRNSSQPIIDQAGQFAQNVNAPAAGLDPNSAEYQRSVQAGKGLSALATLGQQNLQGNQAADQTYFQGQAANAAGALPGLLAQYLQQEGSLGTQQAGKALELYQALHAQAANEDIARQTLNLNTDKASADTLVAGGYDPVTGKKLPAKPATPSEQRTAADLAFFEKHGYYPPTGPPKPAATDKTGLTPAQQQAADDRASAALGKRRTASKTAASKVLDVKSRLNTYAKRKVKTGQTVKNKDGSTTEVTRPATPDDVVNMLLAEKFTADQIALARTLNAGKRLTKAQMELAHQIGIEFVPNDWRALKYKVRRPATAKDPASGGQQRPT